MMTSTRRCDFEERSDFISFTASSSMLVPCRRNRRRTCNYDTVSISSKGEREYVSLLHSVLLLLNHLNSQRSPLELHASSKHTAKPSEYKKIFIFFSTTCISVRAGSRTQPLFPPLQALAPPVGPIPIPKLPKAPAPGPALTGIC